MKVCTKCKVEKDFNEYHKRTDQKGGLKSACKKCLNLYCQEHKNNPKHRFTRSKSKAKSRSLEWGLTLEQYSELISHPCYYCNDLLGKSETNCGLDRMDNCKGYVLDNCIGCCYRCNVIKSDQLTVEETLAAVKAIINVRFKI